MHIHGVYLLESDGESPSEPLKAVLNNSGIIFFPATHQHRDQKAPGISYEDDYAGNALAAIIQNGNVEIRYHSKFSAEQVTEILRSLRELPELSVLRNLTVTYRAISLSF
jgi:hypothetical protein